MVPRSSGNWLDGERGDAPGPFLRFILWLYAVAAVLSMLGSGRTGGVPAGPESALAPAPAVPWATTGFKAAGAGTGGVAGMSAVTQFQQDGPLAAKLSQEPGVGGKRAGSILFGSGAHKANLVRRPVEVQVFMMTGFGGREDGALSNFSSEWIRLYWYVYVYYTYNRLSPRPWFDRSFNKTQCKSPFFQSARGRRLVALRQRLGRRCGREWGRSGRRGGRDDRGGQWINLPKSCCAFTHL